MNDKLKKPEHPEAVNLDSATIRSFGDEWSRSDQHELDERKLSRMCDQYSAYSPRCILPFKSIHDAQTAAIGSAPLWSRGHPV